MPTHPKIVFGGALFGAQPLETGNQYLDVLKKNGIDELDTAFIYPDSHKAMGQLETKGFVIDSKAPGFYAGSLKRESILEAMDKTLEDLKVDSINIYFFHSPDHSTPIEESLAAMNDLYKAGKFKKFGLSNFSATEIKQIHTICTTNSYPLPTVYQGNYNPVARHLERDVFPVLRELNMSFYAYSPLAGGFLVKDPKFLTEGGNGNEGSRWEKDALFSSLYHGLYNRKSLIDALGKWEEIANDAGVSKAALAYRWMAYSSQLSADKGDALIIGASRVSQLEQTIESIKAGPLDEGVAKRVDEWFDLVRDEAPVDNFHHDVNFKDEDYDQRKKGEGGK